MAKNKKRKKDTRGQEIADRKKRERLYFSKIKEVMNIVGSDEAFEMLDNPFNRKIVWGCRSSPLKVSFGKDLKLDASFEKIWSDLFVRIHKTEKIEVCGKAISFYDVWMYLEPLHVFARNLVEHQLDKKKFLSLLPKLLTEYDEFRDRLYDLIFASAEIMLHRFFLYYPGTLYYDVKKESKNVDGFPRWDTRFEFHVKNYEKETIFIQNEKRNAYKLVLWSKRFGFYNIEVEIRHFIPDSEFGSIKIQVYITGHVLCRLDERLKLYYDHRLVIGILAAFHTPEITNIGHDNYLIAYYIDKIKVGYFFATLSEAKLLVRTFLFITNNGTPEGDKLAEMLNLEKLDKQYLKIDSLDTFMDSDIGKNSKVRECFEKAGCGHIIDCGLESIIVSDYVECADKISKYLKFDEKEEEVTDGSNIL